MTASALPYGDHVIHFEQFELLELPLSAYNVDIEESDNIIPLEVGSSLSRFFREADDSIRKLENYGIETIRDTILTHTIDEVETHPTFFPSKDTELPTSESAEGLFVPFSELELGNTKEYPFPEHFKRWKDTASVTSSYDAEAAWEVMKGADPPSFTTPFYLSLRNWLQRIAGSIGCVVCWVICCFGITNECCLLLIAWGGFCDDGQYHTTLPKNTCACTEWGTWVEPNSIDTTIRKDVFFR